MDSYDRLFPSQDTMPRGGFGNLIALPLQHGPRQEGNSVFLDDDLEAVSRRQQWAYLASVPRIDADGRADRSRGDPHGKRRRRSHCRKRPTTRTRRRGRARRPGRPRSPRITGPAAGRVSAVLAQRLFVEKDGLPSPLLNQIKRLAAFQNPEFYKKQRMRLSTAMTPRVISCAEDLPQHVALPRGCRTDLEELLRVHGVALEVDDERVARRAARASVPREADPGSGSGGARAPRHDTACLVAPPGVGKTVIGTYLVAAAACSTLVLVHRRPLLDQWSRSSRCSSASTRRRSARSAAESASRTAGSTWR